MTAKEKAQSLYGQYSQILMMSTNPKYHSSKMVKQCALICVDEILKSKPSFDFWDSSTGSERRCNEGFWDEVITEIKNL